MTPVDPQLVSDAVELARSAGELTLHWFNSKSVTVSSKRDGTPVTPADKTAEKFIRHELATLYRGDSVIGEESADFVGTTGRTWIIDPIDGTKAFIHGVPLYSNLIACFDEHGPALGVINLPALGQTLWAGRGLGCKLNDEPVHVSSNSDLGRSWLCSSGFEDWTDSMFSAVRKAGLTMRTWGDAYGFMLVATGMIDAMVDPHVSLWDVAPMPVILTEAGGRFSNLDGDCSLELDPTRDFSAVATNAHIHAPILELMNSNESGDPPLTDTSTESTLQ